MTTAGWEGFRRTGHELVAPQDATVVAKLKAAGAIIVGHGNMPDLANSDTNRGSSFGRTGNAYDVRFSPGGSSGGVVTAVAANMAVLGSGTDTGNSIRMPAATSALVGVYPTRGLVSIAGIAPLDWLLDNTGPIARTATNAAIALAVMGGEDPLDPRTVGSQGSTQRVPFAPKLWAGALKGKRFGVPAFVLAGDGIPFHGIPAGVPEAEAEKLRAAANMRLRPETREMFMKAVEALRAAGAVVIFGDSILPANFAKTASRIATYAYMQDGTNHFLTAFGPVEYHSAADYLKVVGAPLYASSIGAEDAFRNLGGVRIDQRTLDTDPDAERSYHSPRRVTLAAYFEPLDRLKLDGYVYPAIQMPRPNETMPQFDGLKLELQAVALHLSWAGSGHETPPVVRWKCLLHRGRFPVGCECSLGCPAPCPTVAPALVPQNAGRHRSPWPPRCREAAQPIACRTGTQSLDLPRRFSKSEVTGRPHIRAA